MRSTNLEISLDGISNNNTSVATFGLFSTSSGKRSGVKPEYASTVLSDFNLESAMTISYEIESKIEKVLSSARTHTTRSTARMPSLRAAP